ncbi:periplasmic chaperone for outer membrane proteins Skp [Sulfitobacter brevis]|uniref:Periplasmic chaperone for outer membrane proteins Skp n=1 Tax=Sulfitobacter brevis TaxID=74348 RepID=A0A1I1V0E3_9RHOB|nr:OmpH family outer membrane protein [Sulfitobacter brevis]SFD76359.1 periplasmic chaperone for outer membrane proteins Skp [Sulfitobacter brevis]
MTLRFAMAALAMTLTGAAPALAEDQGQQVLGASERGEFQTPVLTINSDRLFSESAYGQRVRQDVSVLVGELEAENRRVEADLEAEELKLTQKRATLAPEDFRKLADAFDEKVQKIRTEQDAKLRALDEQQSREREGFLAAAAPVLEQLMREAGAVVILERRQVWVSITAIEITDEAISLLDEKLGTGKEPPASGTSKP